MTQKWYHCPHCNKKLLTFAEDAICKGFYIVCKQCKNIVEIRKPN